MIKRCIMVFPRFKNIDLIEEIREKYDPLAHHVPPHITLIFPFESNISGDILREHIENVLSGIKPFSVTLKEITPSTSFGNYLFLNITESKEQIIQIHKRLYSGILKEFYPPWLNNEEFIPHLTVGNVNNIEEFNKAVEETKKIKDIFKTTVDSISVEIIDKDENSIIEMDLKLNNIV